MPESNIDKDSGCYIAASGGEMTGMALCGPVHYLGEDSIGWDEARIGATPESESGFTVSGAFTTGPVIPDMELIRHDSRKAVRDARVPEPAASKIAEPLKAFFTKETLSAGTPVTLEMPYSLHASVDAAVIRERVGSAVDRIAAPHGFRMASVSFNAEPLADEKWVDTGLAFIVDGNTYPLEELPARGTASIAVPAGADVLFAFVYDGVAQTVSVPDKVLDTGEASSLYTRGAKGQYEGENKRTANLMYQHIFAHKLPHFSNPEYPLGWAGKGRSWIKATVEFAVPVGGPSLDYTDLELVSAVMTSADGMEWEPGTTGATNVSIRNARKIDAFYNVPDDIGDVVWNVTAKDADGKLYESGPLAMEFSDE